MAKAKLSSLPKAGPSRTKESSKADEVKQLEARIAANSEDLNVYFLCFCLANLLLAYAFSR